MTLRVGHIDYLNCVPFFHHFEADACGASFVTGTPAHLNELLANGQLDICPASSFEYGRHWRDYLLLPDLSISACGPVQSVLLFAHRPLAELSDAPIDLTGESATSVHLLQILLREHCGFDALQLHRPSAPVEEVVAKGGAGLLIGDRALKAASSGLAPYVFDLGSLWHDFSGLPFVFALWLVRRDVAKDRAKEVACLQQQLRSGLARALAHMPALAAQVADPCWMTPKELLDYWRAISYSFPADHQQGLLRFFQLAVKHRMLEVLPELNFFAAPFSVDAQELID